MSYKILVIDDNLDNSLLIEGILTTESHDYSCVFALDGKEGYQIAIEESPDLILMDMMMPELSGLESMKLIRQNEELKDIPIIFITAYKTPQNMEEAFREGAIDFIGKPIDVNELRSRVNKALSIGETLKRIRNKINLYEQEREEIEKSVILTQNEQNSFIIINLEGKIEWANEGFKNLHGISLDNLKTDNKATVFDLYTDENINKLLEKCITDKVPINFVSKIIIDERHTKWLQTIVSPQFKENGKLDNLIAVETDVTDLKRKERVLAKQNRKMLHITQNLETANIQLEKQKREIEEQKYIIEEEQEKSERLLLNILPFEVARQLKSKGKAGTRFYKHVSVLFTDFKGFSKIAKKLEPKDLVSILDTYFAKFDEITGNHYLEKIKTIGDAYMCAGGLPLRNKSNPVDAVLAGLEIQNYMNQLNDIKVLKKEDVWELRVGVHTGPVVAGVVGKKKFAYDIWGATVNIAARMEENSHAGMVNVSGTTYEYIKDYFECVHRGKIDAKNVGKIDMYFVNRIKSEFSEDELGLIPNQEFKLLVNKL